VSLEYQAGETPYTIHTHTLQNIKLSIRSQVWWHMPVIPALERLRQKDHEFKARLDYTVRPCLKKPKPTIQTTTTTKKARHKTKTEKLSEHQV
jgi:hypothetical protein